MQDVALGICRQLLIPYGIYQEKKETQTFLAFRSNVMSSVSLAGNQLQHKDHE